MIVHGARPASASRPRRRAVSESGGSPFEAGGGAFSSRAARSGTGPVLGLGSQLGTPDCELGIARRSARSWSPASTIPPRRLALKLVRCVLAVRVRPRHNQLRARSPRPDSFRVWNDDCTYGTVGQRFEPSAARDERASFLGSVSARARAPSLRSPSSPPFRAGGCTSATDPTSWARDPTSAERSHSGLHPIAKAEAAPLASWDREVEHEQDGGM